jgi:peptidoglycan hydrolase CwlO-like protein
MSDASADIARTDARLDRIETRLDRIETKLDAKIDAISEILRQLTAQGARIEAQQGATKWILGVIATLFGGLVLALMTKIVFPHLGA